MAAADHLGRQFLERHLVDHHAWKHDWLGDYDDGAPDATGNELSEMHAWEHESDTKETSDDWHPNVPHSHSPERIHFH